MLIEHKLKNITILILVQFSGKGRHALHCVDNAVHLVLCLSLILFRYVYSRLKWLGNKGLSLAVTMLFLSLWHGLWPGYYISFLYEMMYIMVERTVGWIAIADDRERWDGYGNTAIAGPWLWLE